MGKSEKLKKFQSLRSLEVKTDSLASYFPIRADSPPYLGRGWGRGSKKEAAPNLWMQPPY